MAALESWVEIPPYAAPLHEMEQSTVPATALPSAKDTAAGPSSKRNPSASMNLTQAVLTSALSVSSNPAPSSPRKTAGKLLSTRDQLSIPITAVNFRRFVSRTGSVFWLQDRIEEIVMWRKGWRVTGAWMGAYAFLCFFPRLVLLIPHIALLSILYITYNVRYPANVPEDADPLPPWKPTEPREGSAEWFANLQAIQNLMGFYADAYDSVMPITPHLTHATPFSAPLFTVAMVSFLVILPALPILPLRPIFLVGGLLPFALTHPWSLRVLPKAIPPLLTYAKETVQQFTDNDRLSDETWTSPLQEVELWENERWSNSASSSGATAGWNIANLRTGERNGWTRRRDGWSDASSTTGKGDGSVRSNLTFTLEPGWAFVETEDWRPDLTGSWLEVGADQDGWVYTNDVWGDAHASPVEEWKPKGMTRRRRWHRRIYKPQAKKEAT